MKIATQKYSKNKKRIVLIVASLLLVLATGGIVYGLLGGPNPFSQKKEPSSNETKVNLDEPSKEQTDDGNATKENTLNPEKTPSNNDPVSGSTTQMTITAKNQIKDADQSTLQLRAQIEVVDNKGTCTLTLSDGSNTISRSSNVQPLASVSTCQGFNIDVPSSGLKTGVWSVKISYVSGDINASVTDTVTVK